MITTGIGYFPSLTIHQPVRFGVTSESLLAAWKTYAEQTGQNPWMTPSQMESTLGKHTALRMDSAVSISLMTLHSQGYLERYSRTGRRGVNASSYRLTPKAIQS